MEDNMNTRTDAGEPIGAFYGSLVRTNKQIKDDRARAINDDAELAYKRKVEDIGVKIRRLKAKRDSMTDLSPNNSFSLMPAGDFDGGLFAEEDDKIGIELRDLKIRYDLARERYRELFGKEIS